MAGKDQSVDFNPVVVYADNYYVVDAKIILRNVTRPTTDAVPGSSEIATTPWASPEIALGVSDQRRDPRRHHREQRRRLRTHLIAANLPAARLGLVLEIAADSGSVLVRDRRRRRRILRDRHRRRRPPPRSPPALSDKLRTSSSSRWLTTAEVLHDGTIGIDDIDPSVWSSNVHGSGTLAARPAASDFQCRLPLLHANALEPAGTLYRSNCYVNLQTRSPPASRVPRRLPSSITIVAGDRFSERRRQRAGSTCRQRPPSSSARHATVRRSTLPTPTRPASRSTWRTPTASRQRRVPVFSNSTDQHHLATTSTAAPVPR